MSKPGAPWHLEEKLLKTHSYFGLLIRSVEGTLLHVFYSHRTVIGHNRAHPGDHALHNGVGRLGVRRDRVEQRELARHAVTAQRSVAQVALPHARHRALLFALRVAQDETFEAGVEVV